MCRIGMHIVQLVICGLYQSESHCTTPGTFSHIRTLGCSNLMERLLVVELIHFIPRSSWLAATLICELFWHLHPHSG